MTDYLDRLDLSDEERKKLVSLGAPSAAALLAMIRAAREAFEAFFGIERTAKLVTELDATLTQDEREALAREPRLFALGAVPPPDDHGDE